MAEIEISLTEALLRKKRYQNRIEKETQYFENSIISKNNPVDKLYFDYIIGENNTTKVANKKVDEFNKDRIDSFKSLLSLHSNYTELCKAINKANCETDVVVAGKTMKICEAIAIKNNGVSKLIDSIIDKINSDYIAINNAIDKHNTSKLSQEALNLYISTVLPSDNRDMNKVKEMTEVFEKMNRATLVEGTTPSGDTLSEAINKLRLSSEKFKDEVDLVLAEINSKTMIKVTLED